MNSNENVFGDEAPKLVLPDEHDTEGVMDFADAVLGLLAEDQDIPPPKNRIRGGLSDAGFRERNRLKNHMRPVAMTLAVRGGRIVFVPNFLGLDDQNLN